MSYKQIKWMILLIPTITVGLWEYIRHQFLMPYLSMDAGNWLTPVIVYLVSVTLLSRLFRMLESARAALEQERASKTALAARDQLARELHDGISQSLFLLSVKADKAGRSLSGTNHEQEIREIQKTVHEVNTYVRQAIAQLRYVPSPSLILTRLPCKRRLNLSSAILCLKQTCNGIGLKFLSPPRNKWSCSPVFGKHF